MMRNAAVAMLLIFVGMCGMLAIAGVYEYVICPVWDLWKGRKNPSTAVRRFPSL